MPRRQRRDDQTAQLERSLRGKGSGRADRPGAARAGRSGAPPSPGLAGCCAEAGSWASRRA